MKRQIDDLIKRYRQSAWEYYLKEQKFKKVKKQYEELKAQFESDMLELTDTIGKQSVSFGTNDLACDEGLLSIRKVEKTSIEWDADKLERKLSKSAVKKVIKKKYSIANMSGLIAYLKSCGVDPKVFKTFLAIEKTVDVKAIDQLGNIGEISAQQISGCYIVKCHKPYFTLSVKKDNDDGKEE